jgi:hypothetical protein
MGEERIEILKMVAENKITPEQAERLLRALDDGDAKRREEPRRRPVGERFGQRGGLFGLGEIFEGIGGMVQETVAEAVTGFLGDDELRGLPAIELTGNGFRLEPGSQLSVVQGRLKHGGDLELVPGEGETCKLLDEGGEARVLARGTGAVIVASGALKLMVPPSAAELKVSLRGGAIRGTDLPCPASLRTLGGEIRLARLRFPFEVKTMGGELRLSLEKGLTGESVAETMGGAIELVVPEDLHLRVHAKTLGGRVELEPGLGRKQGSGGFANLESAILDLGEGPGEPASLRLKTLGGNVALRRKAGP